MEPLCLVSWLVFLREELHALAIILIKWVPISMLERTDLKTPLTKTLLCQWKTMHSERLLAHELHVEDPLPTHEGRMNERDIILWMSEHRFVNWVIDFISLDLTRSHGNFCLNICKMENSDDHLISKTETKRTNKADHHTGRVSANFFASDRATVNRYVFLKRSVAKFHSLFAITGNASLLFASVLCGNSDLSPSLRGTAEQNPLRGSIVNSRAFQACTKTSAAHIWLTLSIPVSCSMSLILVLDDLEMWRIDLSMLFCITCNACMSAFRGSSSLVRIPPDPNTLRQYLIFDTKNHPPEKNSFASE